MDARNEETMPVAPVGPTPLDRARSLVAEAEAKVTGFDFKHSMNFQEQGAALAELRTARRALLSLEEEAQRKARVQAARPPETAVPGANAANADHGLDDDAFMPLPKPYYLPDA